MLPRTAKIPDTDWHVAADAVPAAPPASAANASALQLAFGLCITGRPVGDVGTYQDHSWRTRWQTRDCHPIARRVLLLQIFPAILRRNIGRRNDGRTHHRLSPKNRSLYGSFPAPPPCSTKELSPPDTRDCTRAERGWNCRRVRNAFRQPRAQMTVQLIHAPTDTHIWAESYDQ